MIYFLTRGAPPELTHPHVGRVVAAPSGEAPPLMNAISRRIVVGSAVVTLALTMAACGKAGDDKKSDSSTTNHIAATAAP